ncbi:MAG: RsmE family RNA methyltransferase [Breznakia sp.]
MQQYFINEVIANDGIVRFNEEQQHHIKRVLRMKTKEIVKVVDGANKVYLVSLTIHDVVLGTVCKTLTRYDTAFSLTLIQAVMKGDRFDFLVQKACELGVDTIVPLFTKRSVVKANDKTDKKIVRYNKIALEACEQARRDSLASVTKAICLQDIGMYDAELKLVAYEAANTQSMKLKDILRKYPKVTSITMVVGCEGGFDETEIQQLEAMGFIQVSLGKRILRAETAGLSLIANIMYEYE